MTDSRDEHETYAHTESPIITRLQEQIARLTAERDEAYRELVRNADECRETLTELRQRVETLTDERDEARQEVLLSRANEDRLRSQISQARAERDEARQEVLLWVKERCSWAELSDEIKKRGWDCFGQEPDQ